MGDNLPVNSQPTRWLRIAADSLTLEVRVRPGASRRGIVEAGPNGLVVALHSPPAQGRANAELIALLAKALALPRSAIAIIHGAHGRNKTLRIAGANPASLAEKIAQLTPRF